MAYLNNFVKRTMDLSFAPIALIVLAPLLIPIMILIKLDSPGPIFYTHIRVGKDGNLFKCFKFRSMYVDAHPNRLAESNDDPRITKIGKILRKTSLDEIPQLINVLLGDMSIVGPRPALPVQVKYFTDVEKLKLTVKPGLTGWTQVNGRNSIPYEKRMELDVWYAKNHNILLDIWILVKTVRVLLGGSGVYDNKSNSPIE